MWERLDPRGVERKVRIEQVRETDAVGLRDEPQQVAVPVEGPGPAGRDHLEPRLVIAINDAIARRTRIVLESDLDRLVAEPFDLDHLGYTG